MSTITGGGGGTYNPCRVCGFTAEQGARIFLFFDIVFSSTYIVSWIVWLHKNFRYYIDIFQLIVIVLIIGAFMSRFVVAGTLSMQWMPNKDGVIWYKVWAALACAGLVLCILFGSINMTISGLILTAPSLILCYGIWIVMVFTDVIKDVSSHRSIAMVEPVVAAEVITQMVATEVNMDEGFHPHHHHEHDLEHHHEHDLEHHHEHDPEHHHAEHEHIQETSDERRHHRHPHHAGQKKNTFAQQ